ncbi:MAG TPA: DPP IV N-terminal domain-containing protein [Dyella sp.]|uniref:S9 family peptidase n=1 Tax=Dyella sp. TaxID=1869338 RepID=UPI002F93FB90
MNLADKSAALKSQLDFADRHLRYPDLIKDTLVPPQWFREGERFVYWAATGPYAGTWVQVDAHSGQAEPLLPPVELRTQLGRLLQKKIEIPAYLWTAIAPDQQHLLFLFGQRPFSLDLSTHRIEALATNAPLALSLTPGNALSPDGRQVAVQRGDGFSVSDNTHALVERQDEDNLVWEIPKHAWSPDGRRLIVWRNDTRAVHKIPIVDYTDAIEKVAMVPYAKVGTPLPRQELFIVDPAHGRMTPVSADRKEEGYAWLVGWRPDSSEALIVHLSRDGKRMDLSAVDLRTATMRHILHEERAESFIGGLDFYTTGWDTQVLPLDDNRQFLWMSERDGWRHAYRYDYAGQLKGQVTRGTFPVHQVFKATSDGALLVWASAEPNAPYDRLLYRTDLTGASWQRLTTAPGFHRAYPSPSGRYYIDGHSSRTQPRVWDVNAIDGSTTFQYAKADSSALADIHYAPPEPIAALASDGVTPLYGALYKPWNFDPKKHYPVIDCIYAGPFTTAVPWSYVGQSFESRMADSLAQLGFIALVIDVRGSPGRGKAFQDANYGRIGQTEIPDHVAVLKQVAASRPYMDMQRVGIYGHSWGGYFALRGMLTAPDTFKAGYAGAPGALEEDSTVNEPYLGSPKANPEGYRNGSNILAAGNLRGALRIMHGTSDINASLSSTMRMADALIQADKQFELLIMPGQPHSPDGQAQRYYNDDVRMFFLRTLVK